MASPSAARAFARRTFADGRIRTASFAALFGVVAYANAAGYRDAYPTLKDRVGLARTFGANKAVELFYGQPHDLLTVGGYAAWRLAGFGSVLAALWAVLAAVRALRTEEDTGRQELVLASPVSRRGIYTAALAAIGAGSGVLWLGAFAGLAASGLPIGGSAYLALVTVSPVAAFAGIGALASQLASTRRLALQIGFGVVALAFLVRVVADIAGGAGTLRWATPLGWTEELRPFAHPAPGALLLPALAGALLLLGSGAIWESRDIGSGVLKAKDTAAPRLRLLSTPTGQALRNELGGLAAWMIGIGTFALIVGILSTAFSTANLSSSLRRELRKLGGASLATPAGALGFYFVFFALVIGLFTCSQIAAAHREESDGRLETVLVLPVGREGWLAGRLLLAGVSAAVLALGAGAFAWIGADAENAGVSLPRMLEAGANCLPAAMLFLGLGALAYGLVPRASTGASYGVVVLAFVAQLFGSLLGAPHWVLELTPFQHVAAVPAEPFRVTSAAAMVAVGVLAMIAALATFRRRDVIAG